MGDPDGNRPFIPFNFSSVFPFDSLANALSDLPTPQHVEPPGPLSNPPNLPADAPSQQELDEMKRLITTAAQDGEWKRNIATDISAPSASTDAAPSWLNPFCEDLSSAMQHSFKRAPSHTTPPNRATPKRPRPRPTVEVIDLDSPVPQQTSEDISTPRRTPRQRNSTPPQIQPIPRAIVQEPSPRPSNRNHARNLSHKEELQRHEDARHVENEDFQHFIRQLNSFSERPDSLVSSTYQADEPPAMLATGNLGVITDLRHSISLVSASGAMRHADPNLLSKVISILQVRVRSCAKHCREAQSPSSAKHSSRDASLGVMAVCTILDIICAPESPRSLLVEELLDDVSQLLRTVLTMVVFPMCDPLFQNAKLANKRKRKQKDSRLVRKSADDVTLPSDDEREDDGVNSPKTSKSRRILKVDDELLSHCQMFLDCLTSLFRKEQYLPESVVNQVSTVCVQSLTVTGTARLQAHAVRTVSMIFSSYPNHRLSIMDDVRETACSVPGSKRHLRPFHLGDGNTSVRTSSALLVMLLSVASIDLQEHPAPKHVGDMAPDAIKAWCKERETCHQRAVKYAMHVLDPLFSRACQERDQEYRLAFQAFFEDMLTLFGRPQWPAAELMLQSLSVAIITRMRSDTNKTAHARGVAIDILGALLARMSQIHGKKVVNGNAGLPSLSSYDNALEDAREKILLFLKGETSLHSASACSFYEALFVTDDYGLVRQDKKSQTVQQGPDEAKDEDEVIDGQDGVDTEADKDTMITTLERRALKRAESVRLKCSRGDVMSKGDAEAAAHYICANRSFVAGFRTILRAILDGMHDQAPTIRAKSIKALSSMDEACPGLLRLLPEVMDSIGPSCRDVSTLARDAALDLLSRSLLPELKSRSVDGEGEGNSNRESKESLELFSRVYEVIVKRLADTATSVRKRAIGIMRSVLADSLQFCNAARIAPASAVETFRMADVHRERIVDICTNLVPRLEDPETLVKETAERTLRFGIFGFDISQVLPRKTSAVESAPQLSDRLISVFVKLNPAIHMSFISRIVHKVMMIKQAPLIHAVISSTVEQFHSYEDRISSLCAGRHVMKLSDEERAEVMHLSTRRVACTSVICAFGSLDATLIEAHCRSLAPSIKGILDGNISENDLLTVQRILNVLEIGVGQSSGAEASFLEEVIHDIEIIVCQSPVSVLEEASIRCLCVVAKKSGQDSETDGVAVRAAVTFKKFLDGNRGELEVLRNSNSTRPTSMERNARCALTRLGLLARYGSLSAAFIKEIFDTLENVMHILSSSDKRGILIRAAVRAMCHFIIRHRSFLPEGTKQLVWMLENPQLSGDDPAKSDANFSVMREVSTAYQGAQLCIFQGFHELLRDEEERNSSTKINDEPGTGNGISECPTSATRNTPKSEHKSKTVVLAAEEDAEAGYLALSAQAILPSLRTSVLSRSTPIRRVVANVLGLLVRQGLLLPATIVGCLFTLSLDPDSVCREYSFRVIGFIADRHSQMLASAALPALRVCFTESYNICLAVRRAQAQLRAKAREQAEAAGKAPPVIPADEGVDDEEWETDELTSKKIICVAIDAKNGHSLLSPTIMAMRREQRRGVLENVMKEFDPRVVVVQKSKSTGAIGVNGDNDVIDMDSNLVKGDTVNGLNGGDNIVKDDDDVGQVGTDDIVLQGGTNVCGLASLYFFAVTLASLDYTNGAGVGGSLTQGGGTAAAESKLKSAKEEVNELISTATRIISNSGQAVLRVAKHVWHNGKGDASTKSRVVILAAQMCVLLGLKSHLKVERWKCGSEEHLREEEEGGSNAVAKMPVFQPECELLDAVGWSNGKDLVIDEEAGNRQVELFFRLMREDAIDEADLTVPSSRRSGRSTTKSKGGRSARRPRRSGAGGGVGGDEMMIAPGGGATVQRRRPAKRASAARRLRYDDGSDDDDGSDFDPNVR